MGPGQAYASPSAAAAVALSGDVVKIAAGDYHGDVAIWSADNLTICGVGGRARLFADGNSALGQAIWVVYGSNVTVDNLEFHDAAVPDSNGAGIRAAGGDLTVRNSAFFDNQEGILSGNSGTYNVLIERCEFGHNGDGSDQTHNIYIGVANSLTVTDSFFHGAMSGHNLKSRAKVSHIENSYFMDGPDGNSSYLADFSNGGAVYLRGNLFQKSPLTENYVAIAFAAEGFKWSSNTLEMVHNTIVDYRSGGYFLSAPATTQSIKLTANILAGTDSPGLVVGGFSSSSVVQGDNVITQASNFNGADNLTIPNFWPNAALASQALLADVPDATYLNDAPEPLTLRSIPTSGPRRAGALQAAR